MAFLKNSRRYRPIDWLRKLPVLVLLIFCTGQVTAQPFADEIAAFRKMDSAAMPPKKAILLVGSSSFRLWKDADRYFPGYPIINRGFGGSSLPDVIRYADDIIFPYHPKQIIIYCGENDFAADTGLSATAVFNRFVELFNLIRSKYKKTPVAYISMKPSPSRQFLMTKFSETNRMIRDFLAAKRKTAYIDVFTAMLGTDGKPIPEIFIQDNLHMNSKGYAIWKKVMEPYLIK